MSASHTTSGTKGAGRYTDDFGPNVSRILAQATLVVRGRIPQQVRRELSAAVKAGVLGRLKKDGLRPEIFFHPDHKNGAIERQAREAAYSIDCISKVIAVKPVEQRVAETLAALSKANAGVQG